MISTRPQLIKCGFWHNQQSCTSINLHTYWTTIKVDLNFQWINRTLQGINIVNTSFYLLLLFFKTTDWLVRCVLLNPLLMTFAHLFQVSNFPTWVTFRIFESTSEKAQVFYTFNTHWYTAFTSALLECFSCMHFIYVMLIYPISWCPACWSEVVSILCSIFQTSCNIQHFPIG